jgi:hypothetical protein
MSIVVCSADLKSTSVSESHGEGSLGDQRVASQEWGKRLRTQVLM